ncbi:MAG TPA: HAMP domain-containing protein [Oscillospiraceae bacterium]|nr:HAMP domain-containing protein [Oscillospiraceae bacterium]
MADPESLELLSYGVDQISRGNLDYRLEYSNDDEFLPVCTAFNGMAERLERSVELLAATKRTEKSFCLTGSTESLTKTNSFPQYNISRRALLYSLRLMPFYFLYN